MEAGKMRTKLALLVAATKRDGNGEFLAPSVFATPWGDIQPLTNKYMDKTQRTTVESTDVIEIRYIDGVTSAMTVQDGDQIYNIEAVIDPDKKKRKLQLFCYLRNDGLQA
jgi:SPP1 family predicted phage head-tail adaptor